MQPRTSDAMARAASATPNDRFPNDLRRLLDSVPASITSAHLGAVEVLRLTTVGGRVEGAGLRGRTARARPGHCATVGAP